MDTILPLDTHKAEAAGGKEYRNSQENLPQVALSQVDGPESFSDFGLLPDLSPHLGSISLSEQEMSKILSFLTYDKDDNPFKIDTIETLAGNEKHEDDIVEQPTVRTETEVEMDSEASGAIDGERSVAHVDESVTEDTIVTVEGLLTKEEPPNMEVRFFNSNTSISATSICIRSIVILNNRITCWPVNPCSCRLLLQMLHQRAQSRLAALRAHLSKM